MRLKVIAPILNIRKDAAEITADNFVSDLTQGTVFFADSELTGQVHEGINVWYQDQFNRFYWGGAVVPLPDVDEETAAPQFPLPQKQTFTWFNNLKLDFIWNTYRELGGLATIAVLDTGYRTSNFDLTPGITAQKIFIDHSQTINDRGDEAHGTHCSSLAAARNNRLAFVGTAPRSKLMIGKISAATEIRKFDTILDAIEWAAINGADIISISYSIEINNQQERETFEARFNQIIHDHKVIVFAAAGNNFDNPQPVTGERYPASFKNCVSVGATELNGQLSGITVLSEQTIIHAPGVDVESYGQSDNPEPQTGTSFSTPIIAGIAALAVSHSKKHTGSWEPKKIIQAIYDTGTTLPGQTKRKMINPVALFKSLFPNEA